MKSLLQPSNVVSRLAPAAILFWLGCAGLPSYGEWNTHIYGTHAQVATLDTTNVQESSGIVAGRRNAEVFWTHNDSGSSGPRVWAMRLNAADLAAGVARDLGYVELTGATNVDWEDISYGPDHSIYVFDGGDNPPCNRTDKRIHRFLEPVVDPDGARFTLSATFQTLRFEYPDPANPGAPASQDAHRYDAECMFVHPVSGDIFVVTKRTTSDTGTARVYKLPAASITWNSASVHVLEDVTDLTAALGVTASVFSTVTAGDVDADGRRVLIRRYGFAFEFVLPDGEPFENIFQQPPRSLGLPGEVQGEGICYSSDGGDIFTTSEVVYVGGIPVGPTRCPVFRTPWQLANLRARPVWSDAAMVRWDTRQPLNSTVVFGTSPAYDRQAASTEPVSAHGVMLASLSSSTRYYYRVTSGGLSFPPGDQAESWSFITTASVRPDFDADGDVDLEDFGYFQKCLSGAGVPQTRPECQNARLDEDLDVDGADFAIFQACFSGPDLPADPWCDRTY